MTEDELINLNLAEADVLVADQIRRHETAILTHPAFDGDVDEVDQLVAESRVRWIEKRAEIEAWMRQVLQDSERERH